MKKEDVAILERMRMLNPKHRHRWKVVIPWTPQATYRLCRCGKAHPKDLPIRNLKLR